jgi:asparagine N-glycosylation enzyme membrane subunit Stt3
MFHLSKDWKAKLEDINTEHVLFGFTIILENGWNNTFIYPIGPSGFLIIYHVIGFIILVLPDNFEENIIKKGYFDCIDITILECICILIIAYA